jgi:Tol biopolymer transport system component
MAAGGLTRARRRRLWWAAPLTAAAGLVWLVYVMNSDGSSPTRLTPDPSADLGDCWSFDGQYLAFTSDRASPADFDLYIMRTDGTVVSRLTQSAGRRRLPLPMVSPVAARTAARSSTTCPATRIVLGGEVGGTASLVIE